MATLVGLQRLFAGVDVDSFPLLAVFSFRRFFGLACSLLGRLLQ